MHQQLPSIGPIHGQLAALKATTVSLPTMLATAAGVGAATYGIAG